MSQTSNMKLIESTPLVTLAPTWFGNIEANFQTLDAHDHSKNKGVLITPAGMNLNSDTDFGTFNKTLLRSLIFDSQSAVLSSLVDFSNVYVVSGDLYYNNAAGVPVKVTSGTSVNVPSLGSITGLSGTTAAETYVALAKTFVFTQSPMVRAGLDSGPFTTRQPLSGANGVTLRAVAGSNFEITLFPSLPTSTLPVLQNEGIDLDHSNLTTGFLVAAQFASHSLKSAQFSSTAGILQSQLGTLTIDTPQLVNGAITGATRSASNFVVSNSSGAFTTTNTSPTSVTNLSASLTANGNRAVLISLISDGSSSSFVGAKSISTPSGVVAPVGAIFQILQDATVIASVEVFANNPGDLQGDKLVPPGLINHIIFPSAGTHSYSVKIYADITGDSIAAVNKCKLAVWEI